MDETETVPVRRKPNIVLRVIQWIVAGFFGLLALALTMEIRKLGIPDAPVILFWSAMAVAIGLAVAHSPAVFFRLPGKAKVAPYLALLVWFVVFGTYAMQMQSAYERTPEGAREAAARKEQAAQDLVRDAQEAREAGEKARAEESLAEAAEVQKQLEQLTEKLEGCFSWGHQLSDLSEQVKGSLHNPKSFEHVSTELIVPDADRNNVVMTFRAENGFGAIRTAQVRAQLFAEDCTIGKVGEPQPM